MQSTVSRTHSCSVYGIITCLTQPTLYSENKTIRRILTDHFYCSNQQEAEVQQSFITDAKVVFRFSRVSLSRVFLLFATVVYKPALYSIRTLVTGFLKTEV